MTRPAGSVKGALGIVVPKHQSVASLLQAAAAQNTWYTILDTTRDVRVLVVAVVMQTLAEDIELRITIDGIVLVGAQAAAVAGTTYFAVLSYSSDALTFTTTNYSVYRSFQFEGRSVKVEMRKTSNNGANRLDGYVFYQKW